MIAVGFVLVACTLITRVPSAMSEALWEDEVGAVHVVSLPTVSTSLRQIVTHESTPPAYYFVARIADRAAFGLDWESRTLISRLLSVAFSVACTALTFFLALRLLPLWFAAVAGLLASLAAVLVAHGSELRAYSLLALLCVAFAILVERAAEQPTRRRLVALMAIIALGSLTHYFFLFTLAAGAIWLVASGQRRSVLRRVGVAVGLALIPLAAWSPLWVYQYRNGIYATSPAFSSDRFLELVASVFAPQAVANRAGSLVNAGITLAVLVPSALLVRRVEGRLVALCVLIPLLVVAALAWTTGERIFNSRNLIGIAPFAAIAVVWGCSLVPWRRVSYMAAAVLAVLVLTGFVYGRTHLGRTPYDRIADELRAQGLKDREPVLWFGSDGGIGPVAWYLTTDEPADQWPRHVRSTPSNRACDAVQVVARTEAGKKWLDRRRADVLAEAAVPSYGDVLHGQRRPDLVVARVAWREGILDGPSAMQNRFLFQLAGATSPCLQP